MPRLEMPGWVRGCLCALRRRVRGAIVLINLVPAAVAMMAETHRSQMCARLLPQLARAFAAFKVSMVCCQVN